MLLHNFSNFRALWIPSSITAKSRWQDYQAVSFGLSTSMPRKWIFMDLEVRSFISKAKWKPSRLTWQIIYSAWNHCNALFCCCNSRNAVFPFFPVDLCSTIGSCNNVCALILQRYFYDLQAIFSDFIPHCVGLFWNICHSSSIKKKGGGFGWSILILLHPSNFERGNILA